MSSMQLFIAIGNLGADPELKYLPAGTPVCNFSIATTEVWKDKAGTKQEKTEWHRCTAWRELAETCSKYLSKGRSVYIEGRLETRTYDKEGQKHYATGVTVHKVVFLGGKTGDRTERGPDGPEPVDRGGQQRPSGGTQAPDSVDDGEIPF